MHLARSGVAVYFSGLVVAIASFWMTWDYDTVGRGASVPSDAFRQVGLTRLAVYGFILGGVGVALLCLSKLPRLAVIVSLSAGMLPIFLTFLIAELAWSNGFNLADSGRGSSEMAWGYLPFIVAGLAMAMGGWMVFAVRARQVTAEVGAAPTAQASRST